jgi:hypothetical protein
MTSANVIAFLPTLPPESNRVEIPKSMQPEDQAKLLRELSVISTAIARAEAVAAERAKAEEQRFRSVEARLRKLEDGAESTGEHKIAKLEAALRERREEQAKWKWWAISITSTLITSAIVGLVVHYLSTR